MPTFKPARPQSQCRMVVRADTHLVKLRFLQALNFEHLRLEHLCTNSAADRLLVTVLFRRPG